MPSYCMGAGVVSQAIVHALTVGKKGMNPSPGMWMQQHGWNLGTHSTVNGLYQQHKAGITSKISQSPPLCEAIFVAKGSQHLLHKGKRGRRGRRRAVGDFLMMGCIFTE